MDGAPSAAPAAPAAVGAADAGQPAQPAGQPAHHSSLEQQQHVALKRLREGLADLSAMQELGQRAAKRAELSRPGSGADGSGDGTNDGSGPGTSVMMLDVPQGGHTTSLLLPSQQPNSSSGGGGQPPLPPGHRLRPASYEPTGTHVGAHGSGTATLGSPTGGLAPASGGSGGSDDAPGQAQQAGGGGMQHAASLESLVPSSGPAIAQMDAAQPLEPEPELPREHVEPAPSSRLGTLKRDRSPSPSNGAPAGGGVGGARGTALVVSFKDSLAAAHVDKHCQLSWSSMAVTACMLPCSAKQPASSFKAPMPPAHHPPPFPLAQAPCGKAPAAAA